MEGVFLRGEVTIIPTKRIIIPFGEGAVSELNIKFSMLYRLHNYCVGFRHDSTADTG